MTPTPPSVLVIAGSDPGGGAGLEADQRVLAVHGCYALTATTALTAQNTQGVQDILVTPPEFLKRQLKAVLEDVKVDVVKVGMLASREIIEIVGDVLGKWQREEKAKQRGGVIILDPVVVSTSGHRLLPEDAIRVLSDRMLSITNFITPNIPEATLLVNDVGHELDSPKSLDDIKNLAKRVQALGPTAVLLKGGHLPLTSAYTLPKGSETASLVIDVLYDGKDFAVMESAYSRSKNTHGTGCSLASALAANIASKKPVEVAVRDACRYVEAGIKMSFELGKGNGPINHFHSLQVLPFTPGHFLEYVLGRPEVRQLWKSFTEHKFVRAIGDGSIPLEVFKRFLVQDYLYLTQFARTNALAAYKSNNMEDITASAQIVLAVQQEMKLHIEYCQGFGISKQQMEASEESQATVAYSRFVLEIGQSGDWLGLQVALASCLVGYQVAAEWVKAQPGSKKDGNRCWKWVDSYGGEEYAEGVKLGRAMIEKHAWKISLHRVEELVCIFVRVTEMEINFWEFDAHLR